MKKLMIISLMGLFLGGLAACGGSGSDQNQNQNQHQNQQKNQ